MNFSKPLPPRPYEYQYPVEYSEIRPRLSIDPALIEDPFAFSDSETAGGDDNYHTSSDALWMTYYSKEPQFDTSTNFDFIPSHSRPPQPDSLPIPPSTPPRSQPLTHPTYSAFPSIPKPCLSFEAEPPRKSWPLRTDPRARPVRSRSHTTPSKFNTTKPSPLGTCTALDSERNASISPFPDSTSQPPFTEPISVFEEEDDDDEESNLEFLTTVFHRVNGTGGSLGRGEKKKKKKKKRSIRRSAGEAWKGVFGMKK